MEATCRTCPFYSDKGMCHEASAVLAADVTAGRPPDYWCSAHPLRQRDRLAAMAMQGILVTQAVLAALAGSAAVNRLLEDVAGDSYRLADALLAAAARPRSDQEAPPCGS